jgi:hypothetical protein
MTAALASQRRLQENRTVIQYEVPGTHNGAIAQDYEMGIEEDFLSDVLEPIYGAERSVIVIANQRHSVLDQLRMGVRHMELDIYNFDRLGGFKVRLHPTHTLAQRERHTQTKETMPPHAFALHRAVSMSVVCVCVCVCAFLCLSVFVPTHTHTLSLSFFFSRCVRVFMTDLTGLGAGY